MPQSDSEETPVLRARAIGLTFVAATACGLAHPILMAGEGYSPFDILVFVLNGAVLFLLLYRTGAAIVHAVRRLLRKDAVPPFTWVGPVLLVGFAAGHLVYDTLFFQKFPRLVVLLTWGVPF